MRFFILIILVFLFVGCKARKSEKAGKRMQDFVIELSDYARGIDNDFILIPQNGSELLFNDVDPDDELNMAFINAIDGYGNEEIFYNGDLAVDDYRLNMLKKVKSTIKVLVADYLSNDADMNEAFQRADNEQFIAFPRASDNYDYMYIPSSVHNENANDILKLADAQNYLYLISSDNYSNKEDFLSAIQATNFDLVIIDAFFGDEILTASDVASLKLKANGGKRLVISYMNVGAAEKYRYYWKKSWGLHHPLWLKRKYDGYKDEIWVKFWKKDWKEIIYGNDESYTKKLLDAGFDGTYLDNVEAFYFLYYKD